MSHKIHTTDGLVLKSRDYGESNRIFWIYTRDLGLVRVLARSVREMRSKIRGTIEDFALVRLSLVEGRELWRVINVVESYHGAGLLRDRAKMRVLARVSALLLRFIQGEETNPELFDDVVSSLSYLRGNDIRNYQDLELLFFMRILYRLGHIDKTQETSMLLDGQLSDKGVEKISTKRRAVTTLIKQAFEESHL